MSTRALIRVTGGLAAAIGLVALVAGPAAAHVEVDPDSAPKGATKVVSFRVPNEKNDASTVQIEVDFPTDHPIPQVLVEQKPGWTFSVEKQTLPKPIKTESGEVTEAVTKITWSGGQIQPNGFDLFPILAGRLPKNVSKLEFKALQTYSDGDVVRWIEPTPKGGPEPEHPAPVLTLTKAAKSHD